MSTSFIRAVVAALLVVTVAACNGSTPASAPTTDVNPITGSRGGSGSAH